MAAAKKKPPQAAPRDPPQPTAAPDEDYHHRFSELESDIYDALVWASLLDKAVEDMARVPGMSRQEMNIACGQLDLVNDALQEVIKRLDANYYQRTEEEAAQ